MEYFISVFLPDLFSDMYDDEQTNKFGDSSFATMLNGQYFFTHGGCYILAKIVKHFIPESIIMIRNNYEHCAISFRDELFDAYGRIDEQERSNYEIASKRDIEYMENGWFGSQYINSLYGMPIADYIINYINDTCRIDGLIKEINAPVEEIVGQKK
jgi:hypothetical protein